MHLLYYKLDLITKVLVMPYATPKPLHCHSLILGYAVGTKFLTFIERGQACGSGVSK